MREIGNKRERKEHQMRGRGRCMYMGVDDMSE